MKKRQRTWTSDDGGEIRELILTPEKISITYYDQFENPKQSKPKKYSRATIYNERILEICTKEGLIQFYDLVKIVKIISLPKNCFVDIVTLCNEIFIIQTTGSKQVAYDQNGKKIAQDHKYNIKMSIYDGIFVIEKWDNNDKLISYEYVE